MPTSVYWYRIVEYDCKSCKKTMMVEVFADEQTTLEIMKQNPYCNDCIKSEVK